MNIFWRTIKDERLAFYIWAAVGVGYALLVVSIFPSFKGTDTIQDLLNAFPPFIRGIIGSHLLPINTLDGFLTMEFFSWIPLLGAFFAVMFCSSALSKEMETGSVEILLTQPLSRSKLVVFKFLAFAFYATALVGICLLSLYSCIGHMDLGGQADVDGYFWVAFQTIFTFLAIGAYSLFISSIVREQRKAMGIAAGVTMASFFLHALSGLNKILWEISRLSVFHYFDASLVLRLGHPQWMNVLHLTTFITVFLLAAVYTFDRRDLPA